MTETEFTDIVIQWATGAGWLVHHDRGRMKAHIQGHTGFPDLVLAKAPRLIFAELKIGKKEPTAAQARWLTQCYHAGAVESYVWYPENLPEIVKSLTRQRTAPPMAQPAATPEVIHHRKEGQVPTRTAS